MADAQSNLFINIDTTQALANIRALQAEISAFQTAMVKGNAKQQQIAQGLQRQLLNTVNATGQFSARMTTIASTTESFTNALEKNRLSMREYYRYGMASTKSFGRFFRSEFETINKVARERVKTLQTQYVKMGRDANGALRAIAVRPLALDMENLATKTALAAQRQQIFNQLLKQGSTNLLNFGKNTQWAGRQLMVGFTIPLAIMGTAAIREFKKIEEQAVRFRRVYGDVFSNTADTEEALKNIKTLATEFTKYGIAVEKTIGLAADIAQMGNVGQDLVAQVTEATRLAVLGGIEQQDALNTTISLTSAFGTAAEDLAKKIDFLNSVENQTVLSIEDFNEAIPKAGPVVQQLGGSVEDLAFFLTAMREGGINASEAANALKSGLASIINPTDKAAEFVGKLGINLKGIVEANKGDIKATVIGLAQALDTLDPLNRARAIEQLFGKFQFARISTLFQNVIKDGSQAQQVLRLTQATTAELAALSERELRRVEESPAFKLQKQIEKLKASLAPVGEEFIKLITPLIDFATKILDQFSNLDSGVKTFITGTIAVLGGIAPVALMAFGLLANGIANIIKLFGTIRGVYQKAGSQSQILGQQTQYMTQEQLEAAAVAASLNQSHNTLIQTFTAEVGALNNLAAAYSRVANAQAKAAAGFGPGIPTNIGKGKKKFANGGIIKGPGTGRSDSIIARVSNGEAIIPANEVKKNPGLVKGLIAGDIPGFSEGGIIDFKGKQFKAKTQAGANSIRNTIKMLQAKGISDAQILQRLENLSNRPVPKVNATALAKNFGYTASGTAIERGKGLTSAPYAITAAKNKFAPQFAKEQEFIAKQATRLGLSATQIANATQLHASHLTNEVGPDGRKIWTPNRLTADMGYVNTFLQGLNKGQDAKMLQSMSAKELSNLGINKAELNKLIAGQHPTNTSAAKTMKAVADYLAVNGTKANSRPFYQLVSAGLQERFNKQFYAKGMVDLANKPIKSGAVKPTAGAPKPSAVPRIGGKPADSRVVALSPGKETLIDTKSTKALRSGRFAFIPQLGILGRADVPGQKPLPGMPPLPGFAKDPFAGNINYGIPKPEQTKEAGKLFNKEAFKPKNIVAAGKNFAKSTVKTIVTKANDSPRLASATARLFGNDIVTTSGRTFAAGTGAEIRTDKAGKQYGYIPGQGKVSVANAQAAIQQQQSAAMPKQSRLPSIMGGAGAVAGMASMGAMMYSMSGGPGADIAGQLMMPLMMMTMILPLLGSKVGLVVAGLAAVVGGFVAVQMALENTRKASRDAALEMSSGKDAMLRFAEAAGTVTPDEYMDQVRANQFSPFVVKPGKTTFGQAFVETESGVAMIESFKKQVEEFGRSDAVEGLTRQLTTAVATGVLSPAQAKSIALSFGSKLNDYGITANISAAISSITGPDGKVLEGNTIKIYTELIQGSTTGLTGEGGLLQTEDLTGGAPMFWWDSEKVAKAEGEAAALIQRVFDENQQIVDALDMQYNKQIEALYNEGKVEEALAKEEEYQQKRKQLVEEYNKQVSAITTDFANVEKGKQDAILRLLVDSAKKIDPAIGAAADRLRKVTRGGVKISGATEQGVTNEERAAQREAAAGIESAKVTILAQLAAGSIDAETFNNLMKTFDPTTGKGAIVWNALAKLSTEVSPAALSQLETVFTALDNPDQAAEISVKISQMDPQEAQDTIDTLSQIATYDKDVNAKVILEYFTNDPDALDNLTTKFEKIDEMKKQGKLDVTALIKEKIIPDTAAAEFEKRGFADMSPGEQQTFTKVFVSRYETITPDMIAAWRAQNPTSTWTDRQIWNELAGAEATQRTEIMGEDTTQVDLNPDPDPGPGGTKEDPYEDILRRLKEIRNGAINAAGGIKELNRVIGDGTKLTPFKGLENQLIKMGRTSQFTDWLLGLDPDEMKKFATIGANGLIKLTKAGIQMQQAFNELAIGEVVVGLQRVQLETKQQNNALKKLVDAGLDVADAYELIQNKAFAAAVSSRQMSTEELAKIVKLQKEVTKELEKQAALQGIRTAIEEFDAAKALTANLEKTGLTKLEIAAVLSDADLRRSAASIISESANIGGLSADAFGQEFNVRISQILSEPEFLQAQWSKSFNAIEETFAAQENALRIGFEIDTEADRKLIQDAQRRIQVLQDKIDDYGFQLEEISREEDKINEQYQKRAEALDRVSFISERIARQQRSQLSIAEAISRGDIAAAAAAIQEARVQEAQDALDEQQRAMDLARERELAAIKSANGLTRKQIEDSILETEKKIFDIRVKELEPAERRVELAQNDLDLAIQKLEVEGKSRAEWNQINNNIVLAQQNTREWIELLKEAAYWAAEAMKGGRGSGGGGSGGPKSLSPAEKAKAAELERLIEITRERVQSGGYTDEAQKQRLIDTNIKRIKALRDITDVANAGAPGVNMFASGGMVPKYLRMGGLLPYKAEGGSIFKPLGTDTIPAMLSPGEFVIRKYAVDNFGVDKLKAINSGTYSGDSVYNYGITLNVSSSSNADEIAHKVITQIKRIDSQRLRSNTF